MNIQIEMAVYVDGMEINFSRDVRRRRQEFCSYLLVITLTIIIFRLDS